MKILRLILAALAGFVTGSFVNLALVNLGPKIIPLPDGADVSSMEGLAASMSLFQPQHFLFPFLGHAIGTLTGALVAIWLGGTYRRLAGYAVGLAFLFGGAYMVYLIPSPFWFALADLALAYLPMVWLAWRIAGDRKSQ